MFDPVPRTRDLVLIGGGHAHCVMLRMWAMKPLPGVRVTLVNPGPEAPYTGMLPGYVAGHYAREAVEIDLVRLARFAGARIVLDAAVGLDPERRQVALGSRPPLEFDICSINIGVSARSGLAGSGHASHRVKPMQGFANAWDAFLADVAAGRTPPHAVAIGGGVGGCELALAMAHRLRGAVRDAGAVKVAVVERNAAILPKDAAALRRELARALARADIAVHTGVEAERAAHGRLHLTSGEEIPASFVASTAGAEPAGWLQDTGLALEDGFVRVDPYLRSVSHPHVFAAGDIAHLGHAPRPKAGVYAVRAGKALHANLRAALSGGKLTRFEPQADYLKLVSLGERRAAAEKWGLALSARWLWRWKDLIDTRFMARLSDLPQMASPEPVAGPVAEGVRALEAGAPLCAGCGSKLARSALAEALASLPAPSRPDVLAGAGDDAAVLRWGEAGAQVVTTDHFRAFTQDGYVLGRILAVHALGDVWAMGAAPQAVLAQITLPGLSAALQTRTAREVLAGVQSILAEAGADLVGGHTSQGAEFAVGLTVTGLAPGGRAIGIGGLEPGEALILTRPLGTGAILAGEMRGQARGRDYAAALEAMQQASARAAEILAPHASAMTDVTGFGLAGHLMAMCEASRTGARVALDRVPALPGALDLIAAGVTSSLHADNARAAGAIEAEAGVLAGAKAQLLFDPQTAGGLLAGVPREVAGTVLDALIEAGYPAAIVGEVTGGAGRIALA